MRVENITTKLVRQLIVGLTVAASFGIVAEQVRADDMGAGMKPPHQEKDWNFMLGGGLSVAPDYEGSNDYTYVPFPQASMSYKNYVFIEGPSLRANIVGLFADDIPVMAGPTISYGGGRKAKANKALEKLGNIDGGLNLGGFLGTQLGPVMFSMNVSKEVEKKRGGLTSDFTLGYMQPLTEALSANAGLTASWANRKYMQEYFGITSAQSASSGYAVYDGKSGFKSVGINLGLDYMWSEHLSFGVGAGYTKLLKNAADSPIVKKEGSSNQYTASLFTSYRF
jgi:MipA family protein